MTYARRTLLAGLAVLCWMAPAAPAAAADRLCDTSFENCRTPLLDLINAEKAGIDVAFWFMEDKRYADALIERFRAGVKVRVLVDTRANPNHPLNQNRIDEMAAAGIPIRRRTATGILHWKMMLFAGQNEVQFSAANYSGASFVPIDPYKNYVDEVIYFTDQPSIVDSFKTKFDDHWTDTSNFTNYANIGSLQREYPTFPIDPALNFVPGEDFGKRSVNRYNAERTRIDVTMFRITDRRHTDAIINAVNRGIPVRMITEPDQYRDPKRYWHSWNVDRLWKAGVEVRHRRHLGQVHQKSVILYDQGMVIFGSSNWTSTSAKRQVEHNYFTTKNSFFQFFVDQFNRKWNNSTGAQETEPFVPLPPDSPTYQSPSDGATGQSTDMTLVWHAGLFAHVYDVYLGTSSNNLSRVAADLQLGPSKTASDFKEHKLPPLNGGTTYYWQIVSKTMADKTAAGPIWSFSTGGTASAPPPNGSPGDGDIVLYAGKASVVKGGWRAVNDGTAAGGARMVHPDAGGGKISRALANPTHYFETTFEAAANTAYRLWIRSQADNDHYANDSVHVQFSGSVNANGNAIYRIGTTSSTVMARQRCDGCNMSNWGWEDNGWNGLGPEIYFASSGTQTIRIQTREDGLSIDQIILSPQKFRTSAPGATNNDNTIYPESSSGSTSSSSELAEIVLHTEDAPLVAGDWRRVADSTAAGNARLADSDEGAAKVQPALAHPDDYFEMTFQADAGAGYRLWLRMNAEGDHWANDSVHVQFSGSVNASGDPIYRIGTTSSAIAVLQGCGGCPISGWGWEDNGWNGNGLRVFFADEGLQTVRVQTREDGISVDQIVLSTSKYLSSAPGSRTNDSTILPKTQSGDGALLTANPLPTEGRLALARPSLSEASMDMGS